MKKINGTKGLWHYDTKFTLAYLLQKIRKDLKSHRKFQATRRNFGDLLSATLRGPSLSRNQRFRQKGALVPECLENCQFAHSVRKFGRVEDAQYNYKAFTLAEVLITLAIIGIVAALTIPSIVTNYQKKQTVVSLKEGYSILNSAINRSIIENGQIKTWDFGAWYDLLQIDNVVSFANKYIIPYLNTIQYCSYQDAGNCHPNPKIRSVCCNLPVRKGAWTLSNGMSIALDGAAYDYLVNIYLDINGHMKKPNQIGKDIFVFEIRKDKNKLIPYYSKTTTGVECAKDNTSSWKNWNCAHKIIIEDNWQIKDDYPW